MSEQAPKPIQPEYLRQNPDAVEDPDTVKTDTDELKDLLRNVPNKLDDLRDVPEQFKASEKLYDEK